jgi:hypothetical protein
VGRLRLGQDLVELGEVRAQPGVLRPELLDDRLLHVVGGEGVPTLIEEVDRVDEVGLLAHGHIVAAWESVFSPKRDDLSRLQLT